MFPQGIVMPRKKRKQIVVEDDPGQSRPLHLDTATRCSGLCIDNADDLFDRTDRLRTSGPSTATEEKEVRPLRDGIRGLGGARV